MLRYLTACCRIVPEGIFHLRVPESAPLGSEVGRIQATDPDAGSNAEVQYSIVPGDDGNMFDVTNTEQSQQGVVVLKTVRLNRVHSLVQFFCFCPVTVSESPWWNDLVTAVHFELWLTG